MPQNKKNNACQTRYYNRFDDINNHFDNRLDSRLNVGGHLEGVENYKQRGLLGKQCNQILVHKTHCHSKRPWFPKIIGYGRNPARLSVSSRLASTKASGTAAAIGTAPSALASPSMLRLPHYNEIFGIELQDSLADRISKFRDFLTFLYGIHCRMPKVPVDLV